MDRPIRPEQVRQAEEDQQERGHERRPGYRQTPERESRQARSPVLVDPIGVGVGKRVLRRDLILLLEVGSKLIVLERVVGLPLKSQHEDERRQAMCHR